MPFAQPFRPSRLSTHSFGQNSLIFSKNASIFSLLDSKSITPANSFSPGEKNLLSFVRSCSFDRIRRSICHKLAANFHAEAGRRSPKQFHFIAMAVVLSSICMTVLTSVCIPADAQTLPGIGKSSHRPQATLMQRYQYAFRIQNNLELSAASSAPRTGATSAGFLQSNLQLTPSQFAAFRAAAHRFAPVDKEVTSRIRALAAADRAKHPATRRLSEEAQFQIDTLLDEKLAAATEQATVLRRALSAPDAAQLDEKIVVLYSEESRKLCWTTARPAKQSAAWPTRQIFARQSNPSQASPRRK